jgi:hypothetical protein
VKTCFAISSVPKTTGHAISGCNKYLILVVAVCLPLQPFRFEAAMQFKGALHSAAVILYGFVSASIQSLQVYWKLLKIYNIYFTIFAVS